MMDAEAGLFDQVVTKDVARFARNAVDFLQCVRRLKSLGIPCLFITANMTSRDSELVLGVLALAAQEESINTSKRIKFTKRINGEKGRVPNLVYGYNKIPGNCFGLVINETEAEIVRRIFKMYVYDGLSPSGIARRLNEDGLKTKRGSSFSQSTVARMLENHLYTGYIINGKEEIADVLDGKRKKLPKENWNIIQRPDLKILDQVLFDLAQKEINNKRLQSEFVFNRRSEEHPFSSILYCSNCNTQYRRILRTYQNTYAYWVCGRRNSRGKDSCSNNVRVEEGALQQAIKEYLEKFLPDTKNASKKIVKLLSREELNSQDIAKRESQIEKTRQRYLELYENCVITMEELIEKNNFLQKELTRLASQKSIVQSDDNILQNLCRDLMAEQGGILPQELDFQFLHGLIDKITVESTGQVFIALKRFLKTR